MLTKSAIIAALLEPYRTGRRLGFDNRKAITIIALTIGATLFEAASLGMMLPVFELVQSGGSVEERVSNSDAWRMLSRGYNSFGLSVSLEALLLTVFACILMRQALRYAHLCYVARTKSDLVCRIRGEGFRRYLTANTAFQDRTRVGSIVNDLTDELRRAVENLFGVVNTISFIGTAAIYIGGMALLSWKITILAATIVACSSILMRRLLRRTQQYGRELTRANQHIGRFLVERLGLARLVRLSGTEAAEQSNVQGLLTWQRDNTANLALMLAQVEVLMEPVVVALGFIILYIAVTVVGTDIGTIGLFLVILLRLLPIVKEMVRNVQGYLGSRGGLQAVDRLLCALAEAKDVSGGSRILTAVKDAIVYDDIAFSYGPGEPALRGVNLVFPAGCMTALVGPSGAGKSTIIDLLPRLRDPQAGQIRIDGVPLQDYSVESLRAAVAYVPQFPLIFDMTVREHICYGRPEATLDEVRKAATLANALDFIEALDKGFDAEIGPNGTNLSGGQRQRLDLARALLRTSPILVLDEPTSNLDPDAEAAFDAALRRIRSETDRTIIIIAHRLKGLRHADRIVVLENGRVTASGTVRELERGDNWFARSLRLQTELDPVA